MARVTPLSGFPEWLPGEQFIENTFVERVRRVFELHGFAPVETRAVEPLDQLLRKGETSKEVYTLRRLQASEEAAAEAERLGLHFDLTVPFARYVLENAGRLQFPFRRYQIQKVWRGERPQEGRYREFRQADIDIVDRDTLALHYDYELPVVAAEALAALPIPQVVIHTSNRKLAQGFYRGLEIADPPAVLRVVDKLDKIGASRVAEELVGLGLSDAQAKACLSLAEIATPDAAFADAVRRLGVTDPLLDEGLDELTLVMEAANGLVPGLLLADLSIARGLDYYTGTVYEAKMRGYEQSGAVGAGGRYDNLAESGSDRFPGVGVSLGITRILGLLFGAGALSASRQVPACVLVAVTAEETRGASDAVAAALRRRGIATEVAPAAAKFGKQIRHADRRGIPFVWFPPSSPADQHEVKDIRSGDQAVADPQTWEPPATDRVPDILTP
ncbi:histidine--tRNA ligase [Virgisporangium aurantiacum]|uniref:Histidine--tRNA ligase n=1 Tax=Virgisporangium aurantiacum TaxID=175570 RepID=A0A8J3Z877_9ACTN|nr:histidine--tRNA ligase [Virgisporangium aurantiacum]GIJ58192.1 histidine--tRNA ligase [Virgisporangium aurantiacum]